MITVSIRYGIRGEGDAEWILTDRKGRFVREIKEGPEFLFTDDLEEAARFHKLVILMNDLATSATGLHFVEENDPRLPWLLADED
jgi:hypothetical protein